MKFLKYRRKFSYGNLEWEYKTLQDIIVKDKEWFEEIIDDIHNDYNWSDKYRGMDYEILDYPPIDWLETHIKGKKQQVNDIQQTIRELEKIYKEMV